MTGLEAEVYSAVSHAVNNRVSYMKQITHGNNTFTLNFTTKNITLSFQGNESEPFVTLNCYSVGVPYGYTFLGTVNVLVALIEQVNW